MTAIKVADPVTILGENYGTNFNWEHEDDMFVDFQIVGGLAVDDPEFFMRYVHSVIEPEEKDLYPMHITPCFAERGIVVIAHMAQHMLELIDGRHCFIVVYENVMGLITASETDMVDIQRASIGFEDNPDQLHYQLQFVRFDDKAVAKIGPAWTPLTMYTARQQQFQPLRINFAKYIET